MEKIPTLFVRDPKTHLVINECTPGCEWAHRGEGTCTKKWDGTACMARDGNFFKRCTIRLNYDSDGKVEYPEGFEPTGEPSSVGKQTGWVPVGDGKEDQWHREAWMGAKPLIPRPGLVIPDGTYELCGPKVRGNPERLGSHRLIKHGCTQAFAPTNYEYAAMYFKDIDIEGVVWHHPDGRMAKLKGTDFGFKRTS